MPHQEACYPSRRLQLGDIPLQEDSIHRPTRQGDVTPEQRRIIHLSHLLVSNSEVRLPRSLRRLLGSSQLHPRRYEAARYL